MLIRQHAPDLDLAFGAQLVKFVGICHFAELGLEPHPEWGESVARLSPDNPIERLAENVYYIPEDVSAYRDAKHRRQCLLELDGYFQALQPAIPRGRPPKEPSETPRQGQIKQDTEWDAKALTAYQASQEQKEKGQKDWKAIATAVGFKVPGDKRARKNLREKIGRLVYSGRKLSTPPE